MSRSKATRSTKPRRSIPWWGVGLAVVVVALAAFGVWSALTPTPAGTPLEVSVAEAATQRDAGAFILDVREPDEWDEFHVPGSTHIPLAQVAARVAELPRDQTIIVVCRSGNRSQQGRDILRDAGFEQVSSLAGGLKDWVALGYPTVSGP
ncbi:MAG: rhodanese-like domain-containing protein [Anaerolineales bacterium]